nr:MAG TPA: hypothetical protein [Caudoviricetes sp.]
MAYQKQYFQNGEVLTAERLNHIEDGIVNQDEQILEQKEQINQANENIKKIYAVNKNLLDNWYFGNPVNQRGKTEYPGNANYTIDRWWGQYDTNLKIKDDGIVMDGSWNIDQHLENTLPNGTYTLSVLFKEHKGTDVLRAIIGNKATGDINVNATYESDGLLSVTATSDKINRLTFGFAGKGTDSVKLIAAKLELGSTQTLAHQENGQWVLNEIPNYAEELAKCQRYFHVYNTSAARPTGGMYNCVPTMRANPVQSTITTADGKTLYANSADL